MRTFAYWRAIGRAMRWARKQDDIVYDRLLLDHHDGHIVEHRWKAVGGTLSVVHFLPGRDGVDVDFTRSTLQFQAYNVEAADEILRMLDALGLIPAELIDGPDEIYGRCARCRGVVQFANGKPLWFDRWVHLDQGAWLRTERHLTQVTAADWDLARARTAAARSIREHL